MNASHPSQGTPADSGESDQREALHDAEHRATETEPANFRDVANAGKIVEIPPLESNPEPIHGLDPK